MVEPLTKRPARMPGRVIQGNHAGFAMAGIRQGLLFREVVEHGDGLCGADRALDRLKRTPVDRAGQRTQDIQPDGRESREFQGVPEGLPGLGYARQVAKPDSLK